MLCHISDGSDQGRVSRNFRRRDPCKQSRSQDIPLKNIVSSLSSLSFLSPRFPSFSSSVFLLPVPLSWVNLLSCVLCFLPYHLSHSKPIATWPNDRGPRLLKLCILNLIFPPSKLFVSDMARAQARVCMCMRVCNVYVHYMFRCIHVHGCTCTLTSTLAEARR